MDEIRRLENQIKQLQRELERQNAEAARFRQRIADENKRKLEAYQKEMRTSLNKHDKEVQKEYQRLLKEYQRSADKEIQEQQLKMDVEYQKLLLSTQQKERECLEKIRQLEALITEFKKDTEHKEQASAREAEKYMTEAALTYKDVDKKPHKKFFPKRIEAYFNAIREARTLYKSGLNEAAIAISISARSGLSRLGYDVDEQLEEWQRQFTLFQNKTELLQMQLEDEVTDWITFATEGKAGSDITDKERRKAQQNINYWSKGTYGTLCRRVSQFRQVIEQEEKDGICEYLKREDSITLDDIKKNIKELDELSDTYNLMSPLYQERYSASCKRADWGELLIDFFMDEINLNWIEEESHFRTVSPEVEQSMDYTQYMQQQYGRSYEKVDTREWLELVFNNSLDTKIFVYIVPYEANHHVENRIVLYIDFSGAVNEDYSRQIYRHICESIHLEEDDDIINFAADVEQLKTNINTVLRDTGKSIEKKIQKMR